jgi:hypothetical protein
MPKGKVAHVVCIATMHALFAQIRTQFLPDQIDIESKKLQKNFHLALEALYVI